LRQIFSLEELHREEEPALVRGAVRHVLHDPRASPPAGGNVPHERRPRSYPSSPKGPSRLGDEPPSALMRPLESHRTSLPSRRRSFALVLANAVLLASLGQNLGWYR
jgi:hypothetical protein